MTTPAKLPEMLWRRKPEPKVLRYRVALIRAGEIGFLAHTFHGETTEEMAEGLVYFVRWLTDWQTAEVPE